MRLDGSRAARAFSERKAYAIRLSAWLVFAVGACEQPRPAAQARAEDPPAVTRHELTSQVLKAPRNFIVAVPDGYAVRAARFPVLVLLDADDQPQFRAAVANAQFLASRGKAPTFIIVGIENGKDRTHELTPVASDAQDKDFPTAGGEDDNLKFITDEVLPWVDSTYRTLRMRVIAGHSFGGMFVINAMIKRPDVFRVGLAMSPSLWWNDNELIKEWSDALARDTTHDRTLFVSSGGREEGIDVPARAFVDVMKAKHARRLAFGYQRYPEHEHLMTPQPSFIDGLRMAFAPLVVDAHALVASATHGKTIDTLELRATLAQSEASYAKTSESFGLPPVYPEAALNTLGAECMLGGAAHFAVSVLRTNTERYPRSANTYDSLGEALAIAGDTVAARAAYQRAIDVSAQTHDPVGNESRLKLAALNAKK